jgi:hypothetical protein
MLIDVGTSSDACVPKKSHCKKFVSRRANNDGCVGGLSCRLRGVYSAQPLSASSSNWSSVVDSDEEIDNNAGV